MNKQRSCAIATSSIAITILIGFIFLWKYHVLPWTKPHWNLILISIDTLRADHLSCYGYNRQTSPWLDRFSELGAVFINTRSSSSWTVPSHMTMFTGLDPSVHKLINYPGPGKLDPKWMTLAQVLKQEEYRTGSFSGGAPIREQHGFDRGFEVFVSNGRRFEDNIPAAKEWLESLEKNERFFLFLHGYNVHKPYTPPPPYNRRFCMNYKGKYSVYDFQPENSRPSPEDLEYVISQYDGEIAYVDDLIDGFLNELDASGVLEKTIVIVTSDHGDEFYEHGKVDHIHTLYDELIKVPLFMFGPTISKAILEEHCGLVDLFPTICDLLNIGVNLPFQGQSLVPLMEGASKKKSQSSFYVKNNRAIFSFTGFSRYPYYVSSLSTKHWKLVEWKLSGMKHFNLETIHDRPRYTYKFQMRTDDFLELFDLQNDPEEKQNLVNEKPEIAKALLDVLREYISYSKKLQIESRPMDEMDEKYIENLKALGYIK